MKINATELARAFSIVDSVAALRGMLSSRFVRITPDDGALDLHLTGASIAAATVSADAIERGNAKFPENYIFVDRRLLGAFLKMHVRASTLTLLATSSGCVLRTGTHKLVVDAAECSGYEDWQQEPKTRRRKLTPDECVAFSAAGVCVSAEKEECSTVRCIPKYGVLASDRMALSAVLDDEWRLLGFVPPLSVSRDDVSVCIGRRGTALLFDNGYLFQPISAQCKRLFPEKSLREIVATVLSADVLATFAKKRLAEAVNQLAALSFDAVGGEKLSAFVFEGAAGSDRVSVRMNLIQGSTERGFRCDVASDFSFAVPVRYVCSWLHVLPASVESVACVAGSYGVAFAARAEKKTYVLAVAPFQVSSTKQE